MNSRDETVLLKLALPKGRMQKGVLELLSEAGIQVRLGERDYRPSISLPGFETKVLKPQNIVEMLHLGSRDVGFAGADWVAEKDAQLIQVLDTGLNPVQVVAAAPKALVVEGELPPGELVVASEYERLTRKWITEKGIGATFVRSYGATEVFPPEDADCIVDNTATGSTLRANGLQIVARLMSSSTRLYVNPRVMENPDKQAAVERLVLLLESVLEARRRVMVEVNVTAEFLEQVIAVLPCMREPTVSPLHGKAGFAVKAAVLRDRLAEVVPEIKARGGTDVVVTRLTQLVP